jgi:hypothetical protein
VYLAKAAEFCPPPNPPARGAVDTAGLGAGVFVAAFAGRTLMVRSAIVERASIEFFLGIVISAG